MKEYKVGLDKSPITFDDGPIAEDNYIIASFGPEGSGKTKFYLSGPGPIGVVPLENKAFKTLSKDGQEMGKRIIKPRDPHALIVDPRKLYGKDDAALKTFYTDQVERTVHTIFGLLDHKETVLVAVDKFGQLCRWIEFSVNGMSGKFKKIKDKVIQDKGESNQEIIDLLNAFSKYKKPIILTHACKDEFVNDNRSGRQTWEGFRFLGSHTNVLIEHRTNLKWDPNSDDEARSWQFSLSVRKCQRNPSLEGPEGQDMLKDGEVALPMLVQRIDPGADLDAWM